MPEDNTKEKCNLYAKPFSLTNMGEQALKSHTAGKKHITVVTQTQKTDSITGFFTVKCGATSQASSSGSHGEPSTPLVCDTDRYKQRFRNVATHRNPMAIYTSRKEQHKAEILWALKCVMSHFSFKSSTYITEIYKAVSRQCYCIEN